MDLQRKIEHPDFYSKLRAKTQNFLKPIKEAISQKENFSACIQDVGSMFTLFFGQDRVENMKDSNSCNKEMFWSFFNFLFDRGIYWPPSPHETAFMMCSHSQDHLQKAQDAILEFIEMQ